MNLPAEPNDRKHKHKFHKSRQQLGVVVLVFQSTQFARIRRHKRWGRRWFKVTNFCLRIKYLEYLFELEPRTGGFGEIAVLLPEITIISYVSLGMQEKKQRTNILFSSRCRPRRVGCPGVVWFVRSSSHFERVPARLKSPFIGVELVDGCGVVFFLSSRKRVRRNELRTSH